MGELPKAEKQRLLALIDPVREPRQAYARTSLPGSELNRAWQLRRDHRAVERLSQLKLDGGSVRILLLLPISVGMLVLNGYYWGAVGCAVFWMLVFWLQLIYFPHAKRRRWIRTYSEQYFALSSSSDPILVTQDAFWEAANPLPSTRNTAASGSRFVAALLRAARQPLDSQNADTSGDLGWFRHIYSLPGEPSAEESGMTDSDWARYAAIYDYFFHPQEEFHTTLDAAQAHLEVAASRLQSR